MKVVGVKSANTLSGGESHKSHKSKIFKTGNLTTADSRERLTVVGLGASAGGLEALEVFFEIMPPDNGMAFVVVQHLDPTHEDMLAELLQHKTKMPVTQIDDGMKVERNHVYVIPPNRDLSISKGVLYLLKPPTTRSPRLSINFFFRTLAEDVRERSIGVILSGMGSDGTLGLKAIREHGGATFVQEPTSAKFDSMVNSAIQEGVADMVATAAEIPKQIIDYVRKAALPKITGNNQTTEESPALEKALLLLEKQTGHDFSAYKRSTLWRRIERRMHLHQLAAIDDYVRHLQQNPQELDLLFKELLIGVTGFFRDEAVWQRLKNDVFPALIASQPDGSTLRAWVAGCSTGEEAYSLAIAFRETLELTSPPRKLSLQIFATDLDPDAIDKARKGSYPATLAKEISEERLQQFFTPAEQGFQVNKEIREMVVFARQNLVSDAPFTKLNLLSCRNLLIYFLADLQRKLLPLFHYCLKPNGILVLGSAETISTATDLFAQISGKERIFRRLETPTQLTRMHFPTAFTHQPMRSTHEDQSKSIKMAAINDIQTLANAFLLSHYPSVAVLTSEAGDILFIHGKTGRYLEAAAGKANWNLFAMAREELNHALFEVFQKAVRKKEAASIKNLQFGSGKTTHAVDISAHPISDPPGLKGMVMVVFTPSPTSMDNEFMPKSQSESDRVRELTAELQRTHAELQCLKEEMQTTSEELKSANEELQSANEELQSLNEELTTSKEEMHSMNEELQTVNQDLINKLQDLARTNSDMKHLLSNTDTAMLFLDNELNVRWFAPQTTEIIHLIASDIGRPITDLVSKLNYPSLAADTREVLQSLVPLEKEIPAHDGRWFSIRIIPYCTNESKVDGLLLTFLDMRESLKIAKKLEECEARMQNKIPPPAKPIHPPHEKESHHKPIHHTASSRPASHHRG